MLTMIKKAAAACPQNSRDAQMWVRNTKMSEIQHGGNNFQLNYVVSYKEKSFNSASFDFFSTSNLNMRIQTIFKSLQKLWLLDDEMSQF